MNMMSDHVRVQILNREYDMDPGGLTALEVQSLARMVDEKMREIADRFSIVDSQKIAVLAAINMALDYVQLKEQQNAGMDALLPRLETLNNKLKEVIPI
jgi:cell division protein ZapA